MNEGADRLRLLPWTGVQGQPCLLLTDGDGGVASRLADRIEEVQLGSRSGFWGACVRDSRSVGRVRLQNSPT